MLERARQLLARALDIDPDGLPDDAAIDTVGAWDSLGHMRLVAVVEEELGRPLTTEEILQILNLTGISEVVGQAAA